MRLALIPALAVSAALAFAPAAMAKHKHKAVPAPSDAAAVAAAHAESCKKAQNRRANNGMILGAVGGAVAGNLLTHGKDKTLGTVVGAGVGGLGGRMLNDKPKDDCK